MKRACFTKQARTWCLPDGATLVERLEQDGKTLHDLAARTERKGRAGWAGLEEGVVLANKYGVCIKIYEWFLGGYTLRAFIQPLSPSARVLLMFRVNNNHYDRLVARNVGSSTAAGRQGAPPPARTKAAKTKAVAAKPRAARPQLAFTQSTPPTARAKGKAKPKPANCFEVLATPGDADELSGDEFDLDTARPASPFPTLCLPAHPLASPLRLPAHPPACLPVHTLRRCVVEGTARVYVDSSNRLRFDY